MLRSWLKKLANVNNVCNHKSTLNVNSTITPLGVTISKAKKYLQHSRATMSSFSFTRDLFLVDDSPLSNGGDTNKCLMNDAIS